MHKLCFAALLGLASCATGRPRMGDIHLRPYTQLGGYPTTFSVQERRLLSPAVDVVVDPDDCLRGTIQSAPLQLCMKPGAAPLPGAEKTERWAGPGGDLTLEVLEHGSQLRVDGFVAAGSRGQSVGMHATVPFGQGPQWDELRKHPALLAIAAAAAGVSGEPTPYYRPE